MKLKHIRRNLLPLVEVNVVPLMDIMTTMLFFLILMASFTNFFSLTSRSNVASTVFTPLEEKDRFTLAVIVNESLSFELYLGKIDKLKIANKEVLLNYLNKNFIGSEQEGFRKIIRSSSSSGQQAELVLNQLLESLSQIKTSFPNENGLIVVLANKIKFQEIINIMERASKTAAGLPLFPDITLQELGS